MKKGKLIIILGPSGSGKTTLANQLILSGVLLDNHQLIPSNVHYTDEEYFEFLKKLTTNYDYKTFYAKKYVTRELRNDDVGVIHCTKEEMNSICDVIIPGYKEGDYIGFDVREMINQIDRNQYPVIVTGFMEALQIILRRFDELGRLDDVYMVGVRSLLESEASYKKLEQSRYGEANSNTSESARRRYEHSLLFARQYYYFGGMDADTGIFDYIVTNLRFKYRPDKDLRNDGTVIYSLATRFNHVGRNPEEKERIKEFLNCDLSKFEPVQESEIKQF